MAANKYQVKVLKDGYSFTDDQGQNRADGTITLVQGPKNIIVDTGGPWDKDFILRGLQQNGLSPADVKFVIGTHGHSDHIGNLNLFPSATCMVSHDICTGDIYTSHDFVKNGPYKLDENVEVISTPGHTSNDISVVVKDTSQGTVVIAGDLFEREADQNNSSLWKEVSENPEIQANNREKVLALADYVVPGHGPIFKVK